MANLHKVFVGCPFTEPIYGHYKRLKKEMEEGSPLEIVLANATVLTSRRPLLEHITVLIRGSAACIFDVTGANPNVALELGIAHAIPVDFLITVKSVKLRKTGSKTSQAPVRPIIADLRGLPRIEYENYTTLRAQLFTQYLPGLSLFTRWSEFKDDNEASIPYALKMFKNMRVSGRLKSQRITRILAGSGIKTRDFLKALKDARLISERTGPKGGFFFPSR